MLKLLLTITLPLYILDQITKWWVVLDFGYLESRIQIPGFLWFTRVHNQGVAFGLGNGSDWAPLVFPFVLLTALVGVSLAWKKGFFEGKLGDIAAALLLSGIIGNLTDRLFQGFWLPEFAQESFLTRLKQGYVVDFLDVKLPGYYQITGNHWPTFNVADSCISIAAILLVVTSFKTVEKEAQ